MKYKEEMPGWKSLYNVYEKLLNDKKRWLYYSVTNDWYKYDLDGLFQDSDAYYFIVHYFCDGNKGNVLGKLNELLRMNDKEYKDEIKSLGIRWKHTVSAFFLGIAFAEIFFGKKHIQFDFKGGIEPFELSYVWFLACLYHDIGYIVEEGLKPKEDDDDQIKKMYDRLEIGVEGIDKNIYEDLKKKAVSPCSYKIIGVDKPIAISDKKTYTDELIEAYFRYRVKEFDVWDHGISGGTLLLDRLIKNYYEKYNERDNRESDLSLFSQNRLRFCYAQLPLFHYISQCIIAHNIWKADKDSEDIYRNYGMDNLIGNNYRKISFYDNPLLFLLALVDTIEPIKKLNKKNPEMSVLELLKNILIHSDKEGIHFKFTNEFTWNKNKELKSNIEYWIDASVDVHDETNTVDIKIPNAEKKRRIRNCRGSENI